MLPDKEMLAAMEPSQDKDTLVGEPLAAAAYDRVPFSTGSCVFTMDTSTDILLLHSMQVVSSHPTPLAWVKGSVAWSSFFSCGCR